MELYEAAKFYNDFSDLLKDSHQAELSENVEAISTQEEFST